MHMTVTSNYYQWENKYERMHIFSFDFVLDQSVLRASLQTPGRHNKPVWKYVCAPRQLHCASGGGGGPGTEEFQFYSSQSFKCVTVIFMAKLSDVRSCLRIFDSIHRAAGYHKLPLLTTISCSPFWENLLLIVGGTEIKHDQTQLGQVC
jgi:hypothetical protein